MRADKLVYLLPRLAPQEFFSLIGRSPDDALRYEFKSIELKETSFRLDGVFVPKSQDDAICFVEAQFQPDETFYARFFAEICWFLKQCPATRWQAVAIYLSRNAEQKSAEAYQDLLSLERAKRVYLDELPETEAVAKPERTAGEAARKMAQKASEGV